MGKSFAGAIGIAGPSVLVLATMAGALGGVRVESTPESGLQPDAVVDSAGVAHLVYLTGAPSGADVRYTSRKSGEPWHKPVTVNSAGQSAVAIGSIRGAQIAVGARGSIHVVWNGAAGAAGGLWYARRGAGAETFSTQCDLLGETRALDGGASIATGADGRVYIAWHAALAGQPPGEASRRVFWRQSDDDGATFTDPEPVNGIAAGICACCSLRLAVDSENAPLIFFRSAPTRDRRPMSLAVKARSGWKVGEVESWNIAACPMSSASLAVQATGTAAAWETDGHIRFSRIGKDASMGRAESFGKSAKHPALAVNGAGETLLAWAEGTGWNRGGEVVWQRLDRDGHPLAEQARVPGLPAWGKPAVYAEPDGTFVLLH